MVVFCSGACRVHPIASLARGQTFVGAMHGQVETPAQLIGESPSGSSHFLFRPVHIQGVADNQSVWFPLRYQGANALPVWFCTDRAYRRKGASGSSDGLPDGNADVSLAEIEAKDDHGRGSITAAPRQRGWMVVPVPT
ncbi:MAG: hypothetical protein ACI9W2_000386, partial [Gammaproteobacteria bacterium]